MADRITDESFMRAPFEYTTSGLSGQKIATKMRDAFQDVCAATITSVWSRFGGKAAFIAEMQARIDAGKPLANKPPDRPVDLLDHDQLVRLAHYAMRGFTLRTSLERTGLTALRDAQVRQFIGRKYGSMDAFYAAIGNDVHASRRRACAR